jgi:flavin-dependent dehydrogenase
MGHDLVIAGGGPAGLATAIAAAQAGLSAVVFDPRPLPRDKACGEGLMPRGVAALAQLGVELPEHVPFAGIRWLDGELTAEALFTHGTGAGIRRTTLVSVLAARAQSLGVELLQGRVERWSNGREVRVDTTHGERRARLLVGADGVHSRMRSLAHLDVASRGPKRFGVRRHFRIAPWTELVEVYWARGAEAYVTPISSTEVGVAVLSRDVNDGFEALLARFPELVARLRDAEPVTEARGSGPFPRAAVRRWSHGLALVGDAAGYVDPLTGEGLGLALAAASALIEVLRSGAPLAAYERAWVRATRTHRWATRALLRLAGWPSARRLVTRAAGARPALFTRIVGLVS